MTLFSPFLLPTANAWFAVVVIIIAVDAIIPSAIVAMASVTIIDLFLLRLMYGEYIELCKQF